jgi:hypothetical protein
MYDAIAWSEWTCRNGALQHSAAAGQLSLQLMQLRAGLSYQRMHSKNCLLAHTWYLILTSDEH